MQSTANDNIEPSAEHTRLGLALAGDILSLVQQSKASPTVGYYGLVHAMVAYHSIVLKTAMVHERGKITGNLHQLIDNLLIILQQEH